MAYFLVLVTGELNKSAQVLQSKVDAIQAPSRPPWPLSSFRRKAKEVQKQLDENVKSLTLVTKELKNVTGELNKSTQVLQSKVDAIQAPSRRPQPLSSFRRKAKEVQKQLDENVKSLTLVTKELENNVSITTPNVVAAVRVGGSIIDFFNMRKTKELQKQLDENVKSLTLVTKELRNVTRELNKSTQVLESKVDVIQAPSWPSWPLSSFG
ncbi:Hypothetical predicted protein [Prunus dulcis]|uniref:Uncharacterized protein n=1 Tax=Prunus dulcis TaxID=3755 RepID=A0A5E4EWE8_PRUDU|nr:Hypothetical predicted protein [Prunus dulcis]